MLCFAFFVKRIFLIGRSKLHLVRFKPRVGWDTLWFLGNGFSDPFEEVDVGELFHLVHITLRSDHFFVVEEDPRFFTSALLGGDRFAYECHVVSVLFCE